MTLGASACQFVVYWPCSRSALGSVNGTSVRVVLGTSGSDQHETRPKLLVGPSPPTSGIPCHSGSLPSPPQHRVDNDLLSSTG